jgi:membrane protein DedA with SNARE-associated domain
METAIAWIHQYGCLAGCLLLMLGIVDLPIPDKPLLVRVGHLSFEGDLSAPVPTALCKDPHRWLNV